MGDRMEFPKTFEEFVKMYGFKDRELVYTNGSDLIQIFRVKQWLEHIFDKIRAEISDIYCGPYCEDSMTAVEVKEQVLDIIDKYNTEK